LLVVATSDFAFGVAFPEFDQVQIECMSSGIKRDVNALMKVVIE
jgi:hypothetical protein